MQLILHLWRGSGYLVAVDAGVPIQGDPVTAITIIISHIIIAPYAHLYLGELSPERNHQLPLPLQANKGESNSSSSKRQSGAINHRNRVQLDEWSWCQEGDSVIIPSSSAAVIDIHLIPCANLWWSFNGCVI